MSVVLPLPIKGYSEGFNVSDSPSDTTGEIMNVRPRDSLSGKLRLGKRPGLVKEYSEQIAGAAAPIIAIGSISVIDYKGET